MEADTVVPVGGKGSVEVRMQGCMRVVCMFLCDLTPSPFWTASNGG